MSDTTIFYALSFLGVIAHILSVAWRREEGTVMEWIKERYNLRYLLVTILAAIVFVLVGPGDDADLGSTAVRMNAFGYAGLGAEVVRTMILGPKRTADRKAAKENA